VPKQTVCIMYGFGVRDLTTTLNWLVI